MKRALYKCGILLLLLSKIKCSHKNKFSYFLTEYMHIKIELKSINDLLIWLEVQLMHQSFVPSLTEALGARE